MSKLRQWVGACLVTGTVFHATCSLAAAPLDTPTASQAAPSDAAVASNWQLALPDEDTSVVFRGVVSYDTAGMGQNAMMYPAPGIAGLLAAVITHGILVESSKNEQKTKMEEDANKVLTPYQDVLKTFGQKDLLLRAWQKTRTAGAKVLAGASTQASTEWRVQSVPTFSMTQDQKAIVLVNELSVYPPGQVKAVKTSIRVVSAPAEGEKLSSWWLSEGGARLKEETSNLVAESLDIVWSQMRQTGQVGSGAASTQETVRYVEGGEQKVERADVLQRGCQRVLVKTLRGDLMSVPVTRVSSVCESVREGQAKLGS